MDQGPAITLLLVLSVVAANWPFFGARLLLVGPVRPERGFGWRLLELLLLGALVVGLGMWFEGHVGRRHPQDWAFYVTVLCLMLTYAFPGFAWRYLRRQHGQ